MYQVKKVKQVKRVIKKSMRLLVPVAIAFSMPAYAELVVENPISAISNDKDNYQQIPTDASLLKLLKVMRMDDMMAAMVDSQEGMLEPMMQSALADIDEDITDMQRQELVTVITRYAQQLTKESSQEIVQIAEKEFIQVAKKHYNQAEVDAQIAFYGSEIGQGILDKQPRLMQEYIMAIMPETISIVSKYQERIMPQLKRDISEILD